ncbi:Gfo/Idh/MocA family protein [Micromonospora auratinigra]|uniref:Gfo/Idh/MocA family protein n=1 Tax=Micromonospora auratinigra TaxID=261654 RepID=UPI001E3AB871|nr:Gfo/Idh/MocA family oxidoreductase [Micromonospora auratinigra]
MRVGVLGVADIAVRRMLPAMSASADVDLVAVASRDRARAAGAAARFGCRPVTGYEGVLTDPGVEAVYVPLPLALHARWTGAALDAGKHVLAEKPLTASFTETAHVAEQARRRGLALMENIAFVHHPQHAEVARLVAAGVIGEPRTFRAVFTVPRRPAGDIRLRRDLGGGALADTGVYPVRAALRLLGPDLVVAGAVLSRSGGAEVETAGAALLRTRGGVSAQLEFGMDHGYRSGYEIAGSAGRLSVDHVFTPPADHRPVIRREDRSGTTEIVVPAADQIGLTLTAFARAVRDGRAQLDEAVLHEARLLDAIRAASPPASAEPSAECG